MENKDTLALIREITLNHILGSVIERWVDDLCASGDLNSLESATVEAVRAYKAGLAAFYDAEEPNIYDYQADRNAAKQAPCSGNFRDMESLVKRFFDAIPKSTATKSSRWNP